MRPASRMRFALVGLGYAARTLHLPAIRTVRGAELVGGLDVAAEARRSWTKLTGTPAFDDAGALLQRTRPDVVVVGTPPDSHAAYCLQALAAGAHVICEKPFVMDLEEADAVLDAAERANRQVAVNMEFREMPIFARVLSSIGAPRVGRLMFVQMWQLMDLAPWDERVPWRAAMPDRTLFEGGVHLVDLLLAFFGELPLAVYARRSSGLHPGSADAIHLATFEFSGGRLAQLTIDRLCPGGTRYVEVRADCERASLRASFGGRALVRVGLKRAESPGVRLEVGLGGLAWLERSGARAQLARNPRAPAAAATAALFGKIARAFTEGTESPSPGRAARDTLEVILACYSSAGSGERIPIARGGQPFPTRRP